MERGLRIAVAGASGFVGRALVAELHGDHRVVALGRGVRETAADGPEWRACDLYSLSAVEAALEGCDVAVYLVHSMMPNARLVQADFEDLDLILADNFARAAASRGVSRIVYLGGLLPDGEELSPHLASRREVERALSAHGVPVTSVRAGLVIGHGGSSLEILRKLVTRLPVMLCPSWTATRMQPVALVDAVAALRFAVEHPATAGRVAEIGGPDVLSYRELMMETAKTLGQRRLMIPVPFLSPRLSRLWVTLFSGKSRALVEPLVESLQHEMVVDDPWIQREMGRPGLSAREALADALSGEGPAQVDKPARRPGNDVPSTARSVQRLPRPPACDAPAVAAEYIAWLPKLLRVFLRAERVGDTAGFFLPFTSGPALMLQGSSGPQRTHPGRSRSERWLARASLDGRLVASRVPAHARRRTRRRSRARLPPEAALVGVPLEPGHRALVGDGSLRPPPGAAWPRGLAPALLLHAELHRPRLRILCLRHHALLLVEDGEVRVAEWVVRLEFRGLQPGFDGGVVVALARVRHAEGRPGDGECRVGCDRLLVLRDRAFEILLREERETFLVETPCVGHRDSILRAQ